MSNLLIRIHAEHAGMHPSEALIEVGTPRKQVFVDRRNVHGGWLLVYGFYKKENGLGLIELPGVEATDGSRRIWVSLADCRSGI